MHVPRWWRVQVLSSNDSGLVGDVKRRGMLVRKNSIMFIRWLSQRHALTA